MTTTYIGQPISRVDGRAKVTGTAKYAAEHNTANLAYGYVVTSSVAKGRITRIDAAAARALPGVLEVLTHENTPKLEEVDGSVAEEVGPPGIAFAPLGDDRVFFNQQPVALVVAESFELARYGASLVRVEYAVEPHLTDLEAARPHAFTSKMRPILPATPKARGNASGQRDRAAVKLDVEYIVPVEHHNPMELYGTTAIREDDGTLSVYDKTQGVQNVQRYLTKVFGLGEKDIRVLAPFVGGGFGSGLRPQYTAVLAVMAARVLNRSVRVSVTRQQMFGLSYRPATWQHLVLGAAADGTLQSITHEAVAVTSQFENYTESVVDWSGMAYKCDNVTLDYKLAKVDLNTPADMRAPGAAWGVYALECAMDELAAELRMDPIELRLKNYSDSEQNVGLPYSSKALRECFRQGAERFGWARRTLEPGSMREGNMLVGLGVASGVWEAGQAPASAKAILTSDGNLKVLSATADIGTGTYTVMTQIAADGVGVPIERVTFALGDSTLPTAPVEGGSFTVSSVGSALVAVSAKVRERLLALARKVDNSPLAKATMDEVTFVDASVRSLKDPSRAVSFADAMRHAGLSVIEEEASAAPTAKQQKYARNSHSAVFVEVHVDEDLRTIQVRRVVSAVDGARIINPKTARSQLLGGIVWGIGMALEEESIVDQRFGRFANHNFAEYHVPVNADVHDVDVIFVHEPDTVVNPLGAKGLGEIALVGVAAAIANAIYHATGKRVRTLPITLDKLM